MRRRPFLQYALLGLTLGFALPALAGGVDSLKQFLDSTRSFKAGFTQTVTSKSGKRAQNASGQLAFQKPGKFRWELEKPYPQLMVGDGQKVWIHDPDLAQVTVKKMDQALGNTPAALLAGSSDMLRNFTLSESGAADGLIWAEARPKNQEAGFERVRLGFTANGDLLAMELYDNFGQTTLLRFQQPERNPVLPGNLFHFVPPKGTDVLGE